MISLSSVLSPQQKAFQNVSRLVRRCSNRHVDGSCSEADASSTASSSDVLSSFKADSISSGTGRRRFFRFLLMFRSFSAFFAAATALVKSQVRTWTSNPSGGQSHWGIRWIDRCHKWSIGPSYPGSRQNRFHTATDVVDWLQCLISKAGHWI